MGNPEKLHKSGWPPALLFSDASTVTTLKGLGEIQATLREAAAVLGVTEQTLLNSFKRDERLRDVFEEAKEHGKASLRRTQFRLAESNAAMAIFLGKNLLGQRDSHDMHMTGSVEVTDARERLEHILLGGSAPRTIEGSAEPSDGSGDG